MTRIPGFIINDFNNVKPFRILFETEKNTTKIYNELIEMKTETEIKS